MGLSKSQRIILLLVVDSVFFLLELIVGYSVHSLALVADSFHMLNDVLSLCVGLWAVKVANTRTNSKMYTYGWQRAETLGALVNGVFLVALCLSIFLEAIQRFFEPQQISSPKLVLVVGCCGLLSNILGLFLFHDHGHSHGHEHGEEETLPSSDAVHLAEEGRATAVHSDDPSVKIDSAESQSPTQQNNGISQDTHLSHTASDPIKTPKRWKSDAPNGHETSRSASAIRQSPGPKHRRHTSASRSRYSNVDEIRIHPASFRNEIIAASRMEDIDSAPPTESEPDSCDEEQAAPRETTPLLNRKDSKQHPDNSDTQHSTHKHRRPKKSSEKTSGHSHGDLNMQGVFLHVMGDALGNIGVIASALFIWLTDYCWRFYSDPLISLVITVIILCSALPLCRAASRILLQAAPVGISVDDIKEDIEDLPGVVSCHHLHVWQLSDTKLVASLHVQVAFDYKGTDSEQYMKLAKAVRTCLHEYGIHSSTIQPEFHLGDQHEHASVKMATDGSSTAVLTVAGDGAASKRSSKLGSRTASLKSLPDACLLDCDDKCGNGKRCCGPSSPRDGNQH